ncbi:MAG: hypothetical protein JJ837_07840 [Prochlorococcus marinus XMU1428]|nr:hypothetical protein [Prochlorococcus marinus XMU1428]
MNFINKSNIELINKKFQENNFEGIVFFVSDKKFSRFVSPLLSSLEIFAENWLQIYFQIGNFKFENKNKFNLLEIKIKNEFIKEKDKKAFCANIRVPILYELINEINISKLIYTDVDNILTNNINNLFYGNEYKIFLRKVNKNILDFSLKTKNIMHYKSGVIALSNPSKSFLRKDHDIKSFIETFNDFSKERLNIWFEDQIALYKTFKSMPHITKVSYFGAKICDWNLDPFSIFWAAKGYIKDTFIWKLLSLKIILLNKLYKSKFFKNPSTNSKVISILNTLVNILIKPIIFFRFTIYNYCFRSIKYLYKLIFIK